MTGSLYFRECVCQLLNSEYPQFASYFSIEQKCFMHSLLLPQNIKNTRTQGGRFSDITFSYCSFEDILNWTAFPANTWQWIVGVLLQLGDAAMLCVRAPGFYSPLLWGVSVNVNTIRKAKQALMLLWKEFWPSRTPESVIRTFGRAWTKIWKPLQSGIPR